MEKEMRTLYVEGLAIHDVPESCVGVPRGRSEALTGCVQARRLSREIKGCGVPTPLSEVERAMMRATEPESSTAAFCLTRTLHSPHGRDRCVVEVSESK